MDFHLRFGMHRDAQILHQTKELYEGLVIPAHILAYQPTSTSVFVTSLPDHAYLIDPMTFLFLHPAESFRKEDGDLRPSLRKLCEAYHEDLAEILDELDDDEYVTPHILPNLKEFCKGVVGFQRTAVSKGSEGSKAEKYLRRKGYTDARVTNPRSIVAPYFMFQSVTDPWYRIAVDCLSHSNDALRPHESLSAVIHCKLDALTETGVRQLVTDFAEAEHVLIWFENFNQYAASSEDITTVRKAIAALSDIAEVEMLYGGYLLAMTEADGTAAFSHGILFTEHRSVGTVPGGGGVPERYYIPGIHQFRSLSQTDLILHQFPDLICECRVCSEVLDGNPDRFILFENEPELLREHFLLARKSERDGVASMTQTALAADLRSAHGKYHAGIAALPNPDAFVSRTRMRGLDYLLEWAAGLESD